MKKILLSIAALLLVGLTSSQAQILKLGVIGGANTNSLEFSPVVIGDAVVSQNPESQYGFQLGAVLRLSLPDFLQIQAELIYKESNSRMMVENTRLVDTYMSFKTFEVPVMIGFNIKNFRVFAGPVYRLSSDVEFNQTYNTMSATFKNNIGIQGGVGLDLGKFFIDARYSKFADAPTFNLDVNGSSAIVKTSNKASWALNAGFFF